MGKSEQAQTWSAPIPVAVGNIPKWALMQDLELFELALVEVFQNSVP